MAKQKPTITQKSNKKQKKKEVICYTKHLFINVSPFEQKETEKQINSATYSTH